MVMMIITRHEVRAPPRGQERRRYPVVLYGGMGALREGERATYITGKDIDAVQTMLNPFHTAHSTIVSAVFDGRVRASARKHL